ncbi:MAG: hypothetical protein N3A01_08835 [Bacteroidales bacterium]|nr:hypothetical protein [Bacteroidales bacterium]
MLSQNLFNYKIKTVIPDSNVVKFDSIIVNPLTFKIFHNDTIIDNKYYKLYPITSTIIIDSILLKKNITILYSQWNFKTLPLYYNKDESMIIRDTNKMFKNEKYYIPKPDYYFIKESLIQRGSISRGISIGTNQNATLNSSMNLQLTGSIGGGFEINAVLTDNQLPIQPMGNTAQLNEFDKIFINVFNKNHSFLFGDFDIVNTYEYLSINRKAQGFKYKYNKYENNNSIILETNNSVSKGKYNRMTFKGIEGIQGPYKLKGQNNEPFIIILAGTERVYVDNKLLKRGEDNDYVINYNTAELYFTAKMPITHDSRIVVEFEYSEKNYLRYLTYNTFTYNSEKIVNNTTFYLESDAKNQTIQYSLTDSNKIILSYAGDSINKAIAPFWNYDSIQDNNTIYYKLVDTFVNNIIYKIFVFSTDTSAHYRVNFTYLGKNKGNYTLDKNTINGKIYKWVAPINNIPQGEYEPIWFLPLPQRKIIVNNKLQYNFSKKSSFILEFAISNYDKNLFSKINDNDNNGFFIKTGITNYLTNKNDSSKSFYIQNHFTYISKNFTPIEKLRYIEFSRDWNYSLLKINNEIEGLHEVIFKTFKTNFNSGIQYIFNLNQYEGMKPFINYNYNNGSLKTINKISFLISNQGSFNTSFLNVNSNTEKLVKYLTVGSNILIENNQWKNDTILLPASFKNIKLSSYIRNADTSNYKLIIGYSKRFNYISDSMIFIKSFISNDIFTESYIKTKYLNFNSNITYRNLIPKIEGNTNKTKSLTSNNYLNFYLLKKFIIFSLNHQTSAQLEAKQTFQYIEVAPGKGSYTWIDYNNNTIKELNEFEIARFPDQANYIRIVNPTPDYFKTYSSKLMQNIFLRPSNIIPNKNMITKFISYFNNQFSVQTDIKTKSEKILYKIIPWPFKEDSFHVYTNYNIRNFLNFDYTPLNSSVRYLYQAQQNNNLLYIGNQLIKTESNGIIFTSNLKPSIILNIDGTSEHKESYSDNFLDRNYIILTRSIKTNILFQISNNLRFSPELKVTEKKEKLNNITLKTTESSFEIQKNIKSNIHLNIKYSFINNNIKNLQNSSLTFELLNGLNRGKNHIINILIYCNLTSVLKLNFSYQCRINKDTRTIHYGTVELRAFF